MALAISDPTLTLIRTALEEDAPDGDVTSAAVIDADAIAHGSLLVKQDGILAGTTAASAVFAVAAEQDGLGSIDVLWSHADGEEIHAGATLGGVRGPARTMLRAERVAVNLLSHLSGIATLTRRFVDAASPAKILCTRKTLPGLRSLERDAVLAGGGVLHRASLSDAVLIKDNHLRLSTSLTDAVTRAKSAGLPVEVEVESIAQLDEAIAAGADRILLDNPTTARVGEAVDRIGDADRLEVSGGVTLETAAAFAAAGARWISVGRLTHSAPALDISLEVEP